MVDPHFFYRPDSDTTRGLTINANVAVKDLTPFFLSSAFITQSITLPPA